MSKHIKILSLLIFSAILFLYAGESLSYAQSSSDKEIARMEKQIKANEAENKKLSEQNKKNQRLLDEMKRKGEQNSKKAKELQSHINSNKIKMKEFKNKIDSLNAAKDAQIGVYRNIFPKMLRNRVNTSGLYKNEDLIKIMFIRNSILNSLSEAKRLEWEKKQNADRRAKVERDNKNINTEKKKIDESKKKDNALAKTLTSQINKNIKKQDALAKTNKELEKKIAARRAEFKAIAEKLKKNMDSGKSKISVQNRDNSYASSKIAKGSLAWPTKDGNIVEKKDGCVFIQASKNAQIKSIISGKVINTTSTADTNSNMIAIQNGDDYLLIFNGKGQITATTHDTVSPGKVIATADSTGIYQICLQIDKSFVKVEEYLKK